MNKPKALDLLLVLVAFVVGVVWIGGAFSNQDLLWFYPAFDARPEVVCIYRHGAVAALTPAQAGYDPLVAALNAAVTRHAGFFAEWEPVGGSLASYLERGYAIEARYAEPVRVHTRYFFPPNRRLLVAVEGTYNAFTHSALLFRGDAQRWLPGGIALESVSDLRAAADAAGDAAARDAGALAQAARCTGP